MEDKLIVLQQNIDHRVKEIFDYQINIDNYKRMIKKIEDNPDADEQMLQFKEVLEKNLKDSLREQMKSKLVHDVMVDQVNEIQQ